MKSSVTDLNLQLARLDRGRREATACKERLNRRNAGLIRPIDKRSGPLPDKSGVPVAVSKCPAPVTGVGSARKLGRPSANVDGPPGRITTAMRHPHVRCLGSAIFSEEAWSQIALSFQFSRRELQIVRGVFDDLTEMAIASELGISSHTVHTHFERLHRKMGIVDRAELLLRVVSEFLRLTASADSLLPPICSRRTARRCPLRD